MKTDFCIGSSSVSEDYGTILRSARQAVDHISKSDDYGIGNSNPSLEDLIVAGPFVGLWYQLTLVAIIF